MKRLNLQRHRDFIMAALMCIVVSVGAFGSYAMSVKLNQRPALGQRAIDDGRPMWFIHGLIYSDDFKIAQQEVDPFKIKLVASGCILGGDKYEKELKNNNQIYAAASEELQVLLRRLRPFN
jgi:hypothetical protein